MTYPRTLSWRTERRQRCRLLRWRLQPRDLARRRRDFREKLKLSLAFGALPSRSHCASCCRLHRLARGRPPAADTVPRRGLAAAVSSSPRRPRTGDATAAPEWSRAGWDGPFDQAARQSATDCGFRRSQLLQWRGSPCIQVLEVRRVIRQGRRKNYGASPLFTTTNTSLQKNILIVVILYSLLTVILIFVFNSVFLGNRVPFNGLLFRQFSFVVSVSLSVSYPMIKQKT